MKSNFYLKILIKVFVSFLISIFILYNASGGYFNDLVHFLFLIIIFESIVFIFLIESPVVKIYFTFSYLFLGCIPYLEHSNMKFSYWGLPKVLDETLILVNILIFLLNLTVVLVYRFSGRLSFNAVQDFFYKNQVLDSIKDIKNHMIYKDKFISLVIISLLSTFLVLYLNSFSVSNLLYRDGLVDKVYINSSLSLVFSYLIKPIPAIVLIFYLSYKPVGYKYKSLFFLFLCLINIFPTGVPRFYAAAVYLPILILMFNGMIYKNRLSGFIIFSMFFIFPFLNNFRYFKKWSDLDFFNGFDFLYHGHFDSYLSIGQVVQSDFVSYGRQLLGNVFFFIPRVLWPDKPVGTGHTFALDNNLFFTNISVNYYAEGYANFGYLGMFLFAFLLGLFLRYIDEKLILNFSINKKNVGMLPIYLLLLGFIIFVMRGDLLSSISFLVGFLLCVKLCSFLFSVAYRK